MNLPFPLDDCIDRLGLQGVRALALTGSYARGEAGPHSDVDVVRFVDGAAPEPAASESVLHDGYLIVVTTVTPLQVESWFSRPEMATQVIAGVRSARALRDREGYFAAIQARAQAFVWDGAMQERANHWAGAKMVGWIEEVHKGLEGLRRHDIGRMLLARFGLTWGLGRIMVVQRGLLLAGDNAFFAALEQEMGPRSAWIRLWRTSFCIEGDDGRAPTLREQVTAGLRLYALTAELLQPVLRTEDAPLIAETSALVQSALPP